MRLLLYHASSNALGICHSVSVSILQSGVLIGNADYGVGFVCRLGAKYSRFIYGYPIRWRGLQLQIWTGL